MPNIEFFTGFEGCSANGDVISLFDVAIKTNYGATGGFENGKRCVLAGNTSYAYGRKTVSAGKTKAIGCHVQGYGVGAGYTTTNYYALFYFGGPEITVWYNASTYYFQVYRGTTKLLDFYYDWNTTNISHIQFKLYSHATEGEGILIINGVEIFKLSEEIEGEVNTGGQDIIQMGVGAKNCTAIDNLYIADDFCGELKSYLLLPTSDINSDFTPSTGTDNYAMVDESGQDGDTTYNYTETVDAYDLFGFGPAIPANLAVQSLTVVTVARKEDVGDKELRVIANQSATEYALGTKTLLLNYPSAAGEGIVNILPVAPDSTAWGSLTNEAIGAIRFGYEVVQ